MLSPNIRRSKCKGFIIPSKLVINIHFKAVFPIKQTGRKCIIDLFIQNFFHFFKDRKKTEN